MKLKGIGLVLVIGGVAILLLGCSSPATDTPKGSNADLSTLTVSEGTLSPAFAAMTTTYSVNVPNTTTSITVTGTKADSNATVSANNGVSQSLSVGVNTITITVTEQDGTTTKNYVVTVDRAGDYTSATIGTLKYVPAGRFQRDATATNISVISTAYRMSEKEITRAQFLAIMGNDPSNTAYSSGTTDPVQHVNWNHAIAFCNKLSLAEGLSPVYSSSVVSDWAALSYDSIPTYNSSSWSATRATLTNNGYRLPTEMEWMWAAMGAPADGQGGGTNTTGYMKGYAGSSVGAGQTNVGDYVWYYSNSNDKTHPAGSKTANELGLFDMSGNVWEWCSNWYTTYPEGTRIDYQGPFSSLYRAMRGGSWISDSSDWTVANRNNDYPYKHYNNVGFRVIRR